MKAKYYLRGMGLGIMVTSLIFLIAGLFYHPTLSDNEIILEAKKLGMVMEEEGEEAVETKTEDTASEENAKADSEKQDSQDTASGEDTSKEVSSGEDTSKEASTGESDASAEDRDTSATTNQGMGEDDTKETENTGNTSNGAGRENSEEDAEEGENGTSLNGETRGITIEAGQMAAEVCKELKLSGAISDADTFQKYLGDNGYASYLQPGTYEIPEGSSFEEIAKIITQNKVNP